MDLHRADATSRRTMLRAGAAASAAVALGGTGVGNARPASAGLLSYPDYQTLVALAAEAPL